MAKQWVTRVVVTSSRIGVSRRGWPAMSRSKKPPAGSMELCWN
jgi:hypothetical protein